MMDVDEALEKVGGYRRWHLAVFVLLTLSSFLPMCQQSLVFVFIGLYLLQKNAEEFMSVNINFSLSNVKLYCHF